MTDRRILWLYYNVVDKVLVTSDNVGLAVGSYPSVTYKEYPIIFLTLLKADGTPDTTLPATMSFSAACDTDFDHDTDPIIKSYNADINVSGDWDDADTTAGKLSIRLNCNTTTFETAIGANSQVDAQFEIQGRVVITIDGTPTPTPTFVIRFPIKLLNMLDVVDLDAPSASPGDYYTKTETDALFTSYYDASEIDALLAGYYAATATDNLLTSYYTKTATDTLLTSYYTKTATDTLLTAKASLTGSSDVWFGTTAVGPILKDRTTGLSYRLAIDNAALGLEPV